MLYGKSVVVASLITGFVGLPIALTATPVVAQPLGQSQSPQQAEGDRLFKLAEQQLRSQQYEAAIQSWTHALAVYQRLKDRSKEASTLYNIGIAYGFLSDFEQATVYLQQALPLIQQFQSPAREGMALNNLGNAARMTAKYENAVAYFQRALAIFQKLKNLDREAIVLCNLALTYTAFSQPEKAISYYQKALPIIQKLKNHKIEVEIHFELGVAYSKLSRHDQALFHYEKALPIYRLLSNRLGEGVILMNIGAAYGVLGNHEKSLAYSQQALPILRSLRNREKEAIALRNMGESYVNLSRPSEGITYSYQALSIYQQIKDRNGEASVLRGLCGTYIMLRRSEKGISYCKKSLFIFSSQNTSDQAKVRSNLGTASIYLDDYENAVKWYQQPLQIFRQLKDLKGEVAILGRLGEAYQVLSQYEQAISVVQSALSIYDKINDPIGQAIERTRIGSVYLNLAQYEKARTYFEQALSIARQNKDNRVEATALSGLGRLYYRLSQPRKAIFYYQQSLMIGQQLQGVENAVSVVLSDLSNSYILLSQYEEAIFYSRQSLAVARQGKNLLGEAFALEGLGRIYTLLNQFEKALFYYQKALPIFRQIRSREGEAALLHNLGRLYAKRQQPEVAIAFYKQSVNVRQTIREGIRNLPREDQEAYTQSVSYTYRALANLLLAQGRIAEAQQVLELLKLQELREFARETRTTDAPASIALDQSETEILKAHSTLVAFAQTLRQCADDVTCARSPRLQVLTAQRDRQNLAFANLIKTLETQLRRETLKDRAFINPNDPNNGFRQRAEAILNSQPGTLLIYPLLLEDKMWLLVGSPGPVFTRYEVKVSQKQLAETILQFRTEMRRCEVNPCTPADTQRVKQISQKLYQWMFPPQLQKELQAIARQPIRNLVFAPDRSTRYIPMGALFDGEKYLIERYTVSTIVAASLTDTRDRLSPQSTVLAMGVSDPVSGFSALPNVPLELDAIVKTKQGQDSQGIFPGTQFLNQTFTKPTLQTQLPGHEILHLATHAKFEPGALEQSFLLLGNGDRFMAPDIRQLQALPGVHLVVLSACETALGGRRDQDGMEIAGLNNAFLERGAKAVIASLWQVNDPSTSLWMQQLYHHLAQGHLTKSQAIQAVQLNFIHGKVTLQDLPNLRAGARRLVERDRSVDFSHPYYWAPFILVGNAL